MRMSVRSTLYTPCADLYQLGSGEHRTPALSRIPEPAACAACETCSNIDSRCKAAALEGWKSICIEIRVAIIEGQYYGTKGKFASSCAHCFHELRYRHRCIVILL